MIDRDLLIAEAIGHAARKFNSKVPIHRSIRFWSLINTEKYGWVPCVTASIRRDLSEVCPDWTYPEITHICAIIMKANFVSESEKEYCRLASGH